MKFSFSMKNYPAARSYVAETAKTIGLKSKIADRQSQVRAINKGKQDLARAQRGGAVGGLSGSAASSLASNPSAFDGGASPRRKGGNGFR